MESVLQRARFARERLAFLKALLVCCHKREYGQRAHPQHGLASVCQCKPLFKGSSGLPRVPGEVQVSPRPKACEGGLRRGSTELQGSGSTCCLYPLLDAVPEYGSDSNRTRLNRGATVGKIPSRGTVLGDRQKSFSLLSPAVQSGDPCVHQSKRRGAVDKAFGQRLEPSFQGLRLADDEVVEPVARDQYARPPVEDGL